MRGPMRRRSKGDAPLTPRRRSTFGRFCQQRSESRIKRTVSCSPRTRALRGPRVPSPISISSSTGFRLYKP